MTGLIAAFGLAKGQIVGITGAGGKTSLLHALAAEMTAAGWRVIVTTTTKIGADQTRLFPSVVALGDPSTVPAGDLTADTVESIRSALDAHGCVCVYDHVEGVKAHGIAPETVTALSTALHPDVILVEADGARGLPLKWSKRTEPVIAPGTTRVIVCAGLSGLGERWKTHLYNADEAYPHIPSMMNSGLIGLPLLEGLLKREIASLSRRTPGVVISLFINDVPADTAASPHEWIERLAETMPAVDRVVMGHIQYRGRVCTLASVWRRVAALVLAAGLARRMGTMKVLLPWQAGYTVLDQVLTRVHEALPGAVFVVTGHRQADVSAIAQTHGAAVVHNPHYETGDMLSSVQAGLNALPAAVCAVLIVLGDQPMMQPATLERLIAAYHAGGSAGGIVAPSYEMRRGHPILIDRQHWPELLALPPGAAPRDVINRYTASIRYVTMDDDSILRDMDTPQQYADERQRAGLPAIHLPLDT